MFYPEIAGQCCRNVTVVNQIQVIKRKNGRIKIPLPPEPVPSHHADGTTRAVLENSHSLQSILRRKPADVIKLINACKLLVVHRV